ncbi:hypothetical protein [Nocardioides stalactiti]|uniref:hypothetical protein n=1 Tax=Nocardioides stalactiti TaxID=2755356 RepID=UPI001600B2E2|nr:hypothetical protein [Nocardioides stalactiti]
MTIDANTSGGAAWTRAAIAAGAAYLAALVLVLPRDLSGKTDAAVAGELLVPALMGFVAGGFLGSAARERWREAASLLAPPVVASLGIALLLGPDLVEQREDRQEASRTYARSHVVDRPTVLGWRKTESAALERQREVIDEKLLDREPGSTAVVTSYQDGLRTVVVQAINTSDSTGLREELEQSPKQALTNFLGGAGVMDPDAFPASVPGIELLCAELPGAGAICGWADLTTIGTASWQLSDAELDEVADLTDRLLDEMRVVDALPE